MYNLNCIFLADEEVDVVRKLADNFLCSVNPISVTDVSLVQPTESSIFIVKISREQSFNTLRKLRTNFSECNFVALTKPALRDRIFALCNSSRYYLAFLPLRIYELTHILNLIQEKNTSIQQKSLFFTGLMEINERFSWPSGQVPVSRVSLYLSALFTDYGFLKTTTERVNFQLAIEEALTNAIEHGNLELSSAFKPEHLGATDEFELLKQQRLADPVYARRSLELVVRLSPARAEISIINLGNGFDAPTSIKKAREGVEQNLLKSSGRGLLLILKCFPRAAYTDEGRHLLLILEK